MKVGKPKSKRVPVRLRHKIEKASAAKQRKQRKLAKQNPEWRSRLKKDPGIPNLFPYKDKILHEIEEAKRNKAEEARRRREAARGGPTVAGSAEDASMSGIVANMEDEDELLDYDVDEDEAGEAEDSSNPMAALLVSARKRASQYAKAVDEEEDNDEMDADSDGSSDSWNGVASPADEGDGFGTAPAVNQDQSRKAYDKAFQQVLSASDVIIYVLDARDPQSTRSQAIERAITASPSKRLVLVLNKIDLVPADVLKAWLIYLRRSFPTLPLRAASSAPNSKSFDHKSLTPQLTADTLIKALKSYAASSGLKRAITVGVIGYPNVGKSSVINALISRLGGRAPSSRSHKECPVGAEAGVTTALREVKLDGKLKLIDSPGIVFPSSSTEEASGAPSRSSGKHSVDQQAKLILLNALPPRDIDDPVPAVSLLLRRLSGSEELFSRLRDVYSLPALMRAGEGGDRDYTTDFLVQVARKRGRLGKGGVPNLHAAAQTVIGDWRDGRIQGWIEAPKDNTTPNGTSSKGKTDEKIIVNEWRKEFKLEGLWGDDDAGELPLESIDVPMAAT